MQGYIEIPPYFDLREEVATFVKGNRQTKVDKRTK